MHPEHCTCAICGPYLRAQAATAPLVPAGDQHDHPTPHRGVDLAAGATIGLIAGGTLWAILGSRAIGVYAAAGVVAIMWRAVQGGLHRWPA